MQIKLEEKRPQSQSKGKFYTAIMWILTVFMFMSGLVFIPAAACVPMFLFSFISAPIDRVQRFLASIKVSGSLQLVILLILFALAVALTPT